MDGTNPIRCELLDIPGAENVRDLGGYTGTDGRTVACRRFIRAGGMDALTQEGVAAVRGLGVRCIIDLRSGMERARNPDTLEQDAAIAYRHIPMLDYIQSSLAGEGQAVFPDSMEEMYLGLLENDKQDFLQVFRIFADPACPTVLFHCTAGKDRTGLVAMLLLGLAGVSAADIAEDYSYSERLRQVQPERREEDGLPAYLFDSPAQRMLDIIAYLERQYGGIPAYLTHIGADADMQAAVLEKLFSTPPAE